MREKLKELLDNLDLIEAVLIKVISITGWLIILINLIQGLR